MRLALGTVQFGVAYGIANAGGRVPLEEAAAIVRLARARGMQTLDTAINYGDSESRLGTIGVSGWQVVSKLPAVPAGTADPLPWAIDLVTESLRRLGLQSMYGLLLHRPADLLTAQGARLFGALQRLKREGLVEKVGVSVYAPSELDALHQRFAFDLVQAPFSVLDRRLAASGWLARLHALGTEVHVRSVFLQGLLLMPAAMRPLAFGRWEGLLTAYDNWLASEGLTAVQACLRSVLSEPEISKVIVGAQSADQLAEILAADGPPLIAPAELSSDDGDLVDPSRW